MMSPSRHKLFTATGDLQPDGTDVVIFGVVLTAGSDTATLILYADTAATAAERVITLSALANTTAKMEFPNGVKLVKSTGVSNVGGHVALTGTSPVGYVYFR